MNWNKIQWVGGKKNQEDLSKVKKTFDAIQLGSWIHKHSKWAIGSTIIEKGSMGKLSWRHIKGIKYRGGSYPIAGSMS